MRKDLERGQNGTPPAVLDEFINRCGVIRDLLEEISEYLDDHLGCDPERIGWGDVGDAGYYIEKLTQIMDHAHAAAGRTPS